MSSRAKPILREYLPLALLIAIIWFAIWGQGSFSFLHSPLPTWRSGDLPLELAGYRAFVNGDMWPFLPRFVRNLNAPFSANWNDFIGQDMTYVIPGVFAYCFGFFEGLNLYLLAVHVLCGLIFYGVGRAFNYQRAYCFAGALIFAFAPLIFFRGLGHTTVSTIWHIPLMLFTITWITSPEKIHVSSKTAWYLSALSCILAGLFSSYYASLFILFLGFNWIVRLSIKDRSSQAISLLIWLILLVEIIERSNYFYFRFTEGINYEVLVRSLSTLASVSLTLPDLIFSPAHQVFITENFLPFSKQYYENIPPFFSSESQLAYIGLIPAFGLCLLVYQTSVLVIAKKVNQISTWFWYALGIFVFSITGGLNYLMGAFGFILLRSNNRFSILLMLIGLYYLCEVQSKKRVSPKTWIACLFIALFAIWDQVPTSHSQVSYLSEGTLESPQLVKRFTEQLERALPNKAMVFQLPVHVFPEGGMTEKMGDYDHVLPYLYSHSLHFSYGSMKGRMDSAWQARVGQLPLRQMIQKLEIYGFSALSINTDAYPDQAASLIKEMGALGYTRVAADGNLIAFALHPSAHPISPAPEWEIHYKETFLKPESSSQYISHWHKGGTAVIEVKRPWYIKRSPNMQNLLSESLDLQLEANSNCNIEIDSKGRDKQVIELKHNQITGLHLIPDELGITQFQMTSNCTLSPNAFRIIEPLVR